MAGRAGGAEQRMVQALETGEDRGIGGWPTERHGLGHARRLPRWTRVAASAGALLMGAALLSACSSSSTSAPQLANSSTLLAKVKSTGELSIAMSAFAPQDFQTSDGTWTGYDVDILKGFAKTLGAKLVVNAMPFASSIEAVSTKRDDISIDVFYEKSRAKVVAYSRPMLYYDDAIAVNSANPQVSAPTVASLTGKRIAVTTGSGEVAEAKAVPNATVKQYSNIDETLQALSTGRVAADLQPQSDIAWAIKQNSSLHVKVLGPVPSSIAPPIVSLRGYYTVPKGAYSSSFLAVLNKYLKTIECNGAEQKILDKYGMTAPIYLEGICQASNVYSG